MSSNFSRHRARLFHNPRALPEREYDRALREVLSRDAFSLARAEIASWPGYRPTPLVGLHELAKSAGLKRIWYKDEGSRFGLGSFKALGGAYAVYRLLAREIGRRQGTTISAAEAPRRQAQGYRFRRHGDLRHRRQPRAFGGLGRADVRLPLRHLHS